MLEPSELLIGMNFLLLAFQVLLFWKDLEIREADLEALMKTNRSRIDDNKLLDISTRIQLNQLETDLYKYFAM